jgi:hypothetical protein
LGYSDLCLAIIRRSLPAVEQFVIPTNQDDEFLHTPAELALGWVEGLSVLVDHFFDVMPAFQMACETNNLTSVSVLLRTKLPIFKSSSINKSGDEVSPLWTLDFARRAGHFGIYKLVMMELWKRRKDVYAVLENHITKEQVIEMRVPEQDMLLD